MRTYAVWKLPVDADDDLVESGNGDAQILRGMSEVTAQLRQIHLRQISSKIGSRIYRKPATHDLGALEIAVVGILSELDHWRDSFPLILKPQSAYETLHWRNLNYYRERLKCFRPLALLGKGGNIQAHIAALKACQEASGQVAMLYQTIRASDKLILNWTCVHDMMSAGFTLLYCGLAQAEASRRQEMLPEDWERQLSHMRSMTECIIDTLSHISEGWATVSTHTKVFKGLACQVADSMRSADPATIDGSRVQDIANSHLGTEGTQGIGHDTGCGHQADVWDAAMVAFLNEPLDLGSIDWGAVDWDAMGLVHGEH